MNICGLGQYEMSLNGSNVTADVLMPGWTEYTKTCLYDTYDVTTLTAAEGLKTEVRLPQIKKPGQFHVILQVEDDGDPHLFAYRRAIIEVRP